MAEGGSGDHRMLRTLERLLAIRGSSLKSALESASDLVAEALSADKVDAFLYDESRDTLVALGSSDQPLSAMQRKHGLDILPVANGGRVVHVFKTGEIFVNGHLDEDEEELKGIKELLGIRSKVGVPLEIGGSIRGMVMIASLQRDFFSQDDVRFAAAVVRWVGVVAHHAELVEEIAANAVEQGRRAVAEELVTVLAHDLRNYLSPVHLRLDMLGRRAQQEGRDKDAEELLLALKSLARADGLVGDLLDVARIDKGLFQVEPRPFDLVALAHDIVSSLATSELAIKVRSGERVVVTADPARIRQCLHNLVANAIKHSPKHGVITIAVSREAREDGEWARVDVDDHGPGVPSDVMPRIFDRFVSGQPKQGGLGLGLYLAKRIAAMHGGDLTLMSSPNRGACFRLTLPGAAAG